MSKSSSFQAQNLIHLRLETSVELLAKLRSHNSHPTDTNSEAKVCHGCWSLPNDLLFHCRPHQLNWIEVWAQWGPGGHGDTIVS